MPLFEIDLPRSFYDEHGEQIGAALLAAQSAALGVPDNDIFQIFRPHDDSELKFHPTYNDVDRRTLVVIRITAVRIYKVADKAALFEAIAVGLEVIGLRREDLLLLISENTWEDWFAGRL